MTGTEFRNLLLQKWGKSYDVQLQRRGERVLLLVMWKYAEQASFPLSGDEYLLHLESILSKLTDWGVLAQVLEALEFTRQNPRLGKAVAIPLALGDRASEWLI